MDRWAIGILAGFVLLIVVDGVFLWIAVRNAPDVVQSYQDAER